MGNIIKMDLAVKLVAEELMEKAKELAGKNQELAKLVTHKQEINSRLNADKKKLEGTIEELSDTLTTGEEIRSVDCEVTFDTDQGRKFVHRIDTHEKVSSCYLSNSDLQIEMKFYGEGDEDEDEACTDEAYINEGEQLVKDTDSGTLEEGKEDNGTGGEPEPGNEKEEDTKNEPTKKRGKSKAKNRRRKG